MLTAGAILIVASLVLGERQAIPELPATWLAMGYITVFGSVAMFGLYVFGIERWTASAMSYTTLLLPFVSVTVATLLTGETFSGAFVLGGVIMLVGVYVGVFRHPHHGRSTATSMPECLPVADCPEPPAVRAPAMASPRP